VLNTPADPLRSHACVEQRYALIKSNLAFLTKKKAPAAKPRKAKNATKPAKAKKK
jgi:hypothetical protein